MPGFMVSEAAATAIFTVTRLLYDSVLGVIALILFSRLPGGSSAKFWYEQPDIVAKITSFFHPFGPTGKRGVGYTNAIALILTVLALALNIVPTILSKLSPITVRPTESNANATLAPVSNMFIPTLTDINLPGLTKLLTSKDATNKFLCSYLANGCLDAKNVEIARIIWDNVSSEAIKFYHADSDSPNNLFVSIDDKFATATTPQQSLFLSKQVFGSNPNFTGVNSIGQWENNSLTGFYVSTIQGDTDGDTTLKTPYDFLHSDQIFPLVTPDLADMLRQGRKDGSNVPTNGSIDRAERWVAVHRTSTLSSVLWQTVNAHGGETGSDWQKTCFFCGLLNMKAGSAQVTSMQNSLITSSTNKTQTFVLKSYIDDDYRLSTMLCLLNINNVTQGVSYNCLHTYSQLWSIYHEGNPYSIIGDYNDVSVAGLGDYGTPFPLFPPPTNITNPRTYIPIVPIFQIRSKGQCATDWNYQTQTAQSWMTDCANSNLRQVNITTLSNITMNIWQLSSTITVGGFLVNATYFDNEVGIWIDMPVIIIVLASVVLYIMGNLVMNFITSPIHRRSLYEAVRVMVPNSKDPYNVQKVLLDLAPTNTLRLVDSVFDKRVSYLKLNNRLIVALSEDHETNDDTSTIDNINNENLSPKEIQNWSRGQLLKF